MNRETININVLDGIDSINSLGNDDFYDDTKEKEEKFINNIKKEEPLKEKIVNDERKIENEKNENIEKKDEKIVNNKDEKINEKEKENIVKEIKKEEIKSIEEEDDDDVEEDEDETIIEKKINRIKTKLIYSLKDDIKFMKIPEGKMPNNKFYLIIFSILTSISIIGDIFSTTISEYKGQISCAVFAIILRIIFILSNLITLKYEFEAILLFQLIINNCLCFYSVLFIIYLNIYHRESVSDEFIWFCYIFYYISIGCNFINIIYLYSKFFRVYVSMTEDDIKYLKIYNKRPSLNDLN